MIIGGKNSHERHGHVVEKSIIIKSLSELDLTLYTESFQKTCPAAEGLIVLTHTPFNLMLNIAFRNVLAAAQQETIDGFTHLYSVISRMMFPAKITVARLYIFLEASVELVPLIWETIPYLLVE